MCIRDLIFSSPSHRSHQLERKDNSVTCIIAIQDREKSGTTNNSLKQNPIKREILVSERERDILVTEIIAIKTQKKRKLGRTYF